MWDLKSEIIISAWKNLITDSIVVLPSVYIFLFSMHQFKITFERIDYPLCSHGAESSGSAGCTHTCHILQTALPQKHFNLVKLYSYFVAQIGILSLPLSIYEI